MLCGDAGDMTTMPCTTLPNRASDSARSRSAVDLLPATASCTR